MIAMKFLNLYRKAKRLASREDGATIVEYTVMLAVLVAAMLSAIEILGPATNNTFADTSNAVRVSDDGGL